MQPAVAKKILEETRATYDRIAAEFDATRYRPWLGFERFLRYVRTGTRVLDIGCGNGRLLQLFVNRDVDYTGIDFSERLVARARRKFPARQFVVGDALALPFGNGQFDVAFMIAVLHHIPSRTFRHCALVEAARVLKPGGILVVTNWERWNRRHAKLLLTFTLRKLLFRSALDFKDVLVPWETAGEQRYMHCFTLGEQRREVSRAGLNVMAAFRQPGAPLGGANRNLAVVAKKG